jgi:EAL domain-containing protein (putative c-di-GMP-specific phosphodiesterase class I)
MLIAPHIDPVKPMPPSTKLRTKFRNALVIDDDPLFQIVVSEGLIAGGVEYVDIASDGVDGMEKLVNARSEIDLVAVDLQMPNMTGVDVIRELARVTFKGAVIIISSEESNLLRSVHNLAKLLGVNILGAMGKPLNVENLHSLIQTEARDEDTKPKRVISRAQVLEAMQNDALVPFYQPKIKLSDGSIAGFEVLTRQKGDDISAKAPIAYLEAIEKYGLSIDFLGRLIERAAEETRPWQSLLKDFKLSFNLTPLAVQDSGLPDRLRAIVNHAGLEPENITFEITENHLLECTAASLEVLSLMRLYGFDLSIDDFGTGATSIEQLRTFPFSELKIDGRFMLSWSDDEFSRLTVQTSAKLAGMLGMRVVAEGVESPEAIKFAKQSGAHEVQGFHFARAMDASQVIVWIKEHVADNAQKGGDVS